MDLGVPKTVRGVITQGARGGDAGSGATTDNRAFVRKYKVAYSLNGKEWNFIMDSKTSLAKVREEGTRTREGNALCVLFNTSSTTLVFGADFRGEHALRHTRTTAL